VSWILTEHSEIFLTEIVVTVMRIALLSVKKMNRVGAIMNTRAKEEKKTARDTFTKYVQTHSNRVDVRGLSGK